MAQRWSDNDRAKTPLQFSHRQCDVVGSKLELDNDTFLYHSTIDYQQCWALEGLYGPWNLPKIPLQSHPWALVHKTTYLIENAILSVTNKANFIYHSTIGYQQCRSINSLWNMSNSCRFCPALVQYNHMQTNPKNNPAVEDLSFCTRCVPHLFLQLSPN